MPWHPNLPSKATYKSTHLCMREGQGEKCSLKSRDRTELAQQLVIVHMSMGIYCLALNRILLKWQKSPCRASNTHEGELKTCAGVAADKALLSDTHAENNREATAMRLTGSVL